MKVDLQFGATHFPAIVPRLGDAESTPASFALVQGNSSRMARTTEGAHVISLSLGFDFPGYHATLVSRCVPSELAMSKALRLFEQHPAVRQHSRAARARRALRSGLSGRRCFGERKPHGC